MKLGVANKIWDPANLNLAKFDGFKHGLVLFSGLEGIQGLVEGDETGTMLSKEFSSLFDFYLDDPLIEQGSRGVRTEEAMLCVMGALYPLLRQYGKCN